MNIIFNDILEKDRDELFEVIYNLGILDNMCDATDNFLMNLFELIDDTYINNTLVYSINKEIKFYLYIHFDLIKVNFFHVKDKYKYKPIYLSRFIRYLLYKRREDVENVLFAFYI